MSRVILTDAPRQYSVVTHTRRGWEIPNGYNADVTRWIGLDTDNNHYCNKWPNITLRKPHLLFYNCHGMTFASRRTCIDEPEAVQRILLEDGYEELAARDVAPGDVVIYHSVTGDPEHSGVIVARPADDALGHLAALVFSKWGAPGPEVIHRLTECPYEAVNLKFYRMMS